MIINSKKILLLCVVLCLGINYLSMASPFAGTTDRHPADSRYEKMDYALYRLINGEINSRQINVLSRSSPKKTETVQVVLILGQDVDASIIQRLESAGAKIQTYRANMIQVEISRSLLADLATWTEILYIRQPRRLKNHAVISEGVSASKANILHSAGITGAGVKIGILDSGFYGYESLLGIELPENVETKNFRNDSCGISNCPSEKHGTAVAEIIHDMAPDAELYLVSINTDLEFVDAIEWLKNNGVQIVNGSIGYTVCGPKDGSSHCSRIAGSLRDVGILPVFSQGNYAVQHWTGENKDQDGDGLIEFDSGIEAIVFSPLSPGEVTVVVNWDDWGNIPDLPSSDQDIDLMVQSIDPITGVAQTVALSASPQAGNLGQEPVEGVVFNAIPYFLYKILLFNYDVTRTFKVDLTVTGDNDNIFDIYPYVEASSLTSPADNSKVLSVGAAGIDGAMHSYSSWGPTWDGRIKPDITAYAGVSTVTYGDLSFYGTSASAPHVTGAAALIKQEHPDWGPDQIQAALEMWAVDTGPAGQDNQAGLGLLKTDDLLATIGPDIDPLGFWWDPGREGSGISIERNSSQDFLAWYTYSSGTSEGSPTWFSSNGQSFNHMLGPNQLLAWQGWPLGTPPGIITPTQAGEITILYTGNDRATLRVKDPATNQVVTTWNLERFLFMANSSDARNGWWWDPLQPGNGFFFEFQDGNLFAVWYHYRSDGTGRWWTIYQPDFSNDGTQALSITEWNGGSCFTCPQLTPYSRKVGEAILTFSTDNSATFSWWANGMHGTYNLEPFLH